MNANGSCYTDYPTMVRVFDEGDHWAIDGIDDNGDYTEVCWDSWDGVSLTREMAIEHAPAFAKEYVWEGATIVLDDEPYNIVGSECIREIRRELEESLGELDA